jgi:mannose-6-phosphate isomerase-like protein (cupin superfamily)
VGTLGTADRHPRDINHPSVRQETDRPMTDCYLVADNKVLLMSKSTWLPSMALRSARSRIAWTVLQLGADMKGFVQDIESLAVRNKAFRQVLYTAKHCQLVLMALQPDAEIGSEVHKLDQFFRVEEGTGEAVLDGVRTAIRAGFAVLVPAGATHNIINTGSSPLKLYTLYAPPNHRDGVVHHTRADAEADTEQFDGKTSE